MTQDIDQFGRDTTNDNTKNLDEEKSKQILDSLAEIKDQLENKEYKPNTEDSKPKIKVVNSNSNSDFDEIRIKIEYLEKKLNSIDIYLKDESNKIGFDKPMSQQLDGNLSVFHQFDNQSSIQQNKSVLVLENESDFHKSNFNLFRFIMTINTLFLVLIGLIVYIKNIPLKDILKIF